ncbi:MAG TPA: hypothetical protein VK348_06070, partial [Planctomycetota bacterium]|nr:hypothetical protein [Planctomycetota bacterium]
LPLLPAGSEGEGFVVDKDGGPVAHALVTVGETGACARTDEIGRYRLPLAPTVTLVVNQPEGGDGNGVCARSEPLQFAASTGLVPLPELVVQRGATIRGTVRRKGGEGMAGVPLLLSGGGLVRCVESGQNGMFRIAGLLQGDYELAALPWRGALGGRQQVALQQGAADCELQVGEASQRRLRVVTAAGAPVPNAYVTTSVDGLRRAVDRADGNGWVEVQSGTAEATTFEVRTADDWKQLKLQRPPVADDRLVVALP